MSRELSSACWRGDVSFVRSALLRPHLAARAEELQAAEEALALVVGQVGLGRTAALHYRASTPYQIR